MGIVGHILLGLGIGAVAAVVAVKAVSAVQEKKHKDEVGYETVEDKIMNKAVEVTAKILGFAGNHLEQIQAATSIIMFALPVVELFLDIRQFRVQDRLEAKMDTITRTLTTKQAVEDTNDFLDFIGKDGKTITSFKLVPADNGTVEVGTF